MINNVPAKLGSVRLRSQSWKGPFSHTSPMDSFQTKKLRSGKEGGVLFQPTPQGKKTTPFLKKRVSNIEAEGCTNN